MLLWNAFRLAKKLALSSGKIQNRMNSGLVIGSKYPDYWIIGVYIQEQTKK
jgi:hypothetical protein